MRDECGEFDGIKIVGETEVLGERLPRATFYTKDPT
jgi:hypothetical protein